MLLTKSQAVSNLSYLRMLHFSHVLTSKLVNDLKESDFGSALASRSTDANSALGADADAATLLASGNTGTVVAIGTMLENAMEELFVPYNEGSKYLEKESKSLGELYAVYLDRFTKYNVRVLFTVSFRLDYSPSPTQRKPPSRPNQQTSSTG